MNKPAAIHNSLVIAPDSAGLVHCLDAVTGKKLWTNDTNAGIWASPLIGYAGATHTSQPNRASCGGQSIALTPGWSHWILPKRGRVY